MMAVMTTGESVSFDKVAAIYDATRGGLERGIRFAAALAPRCGPGPVFEIGVGTGAIALPLRDALGRTIVGADISPAMLVHAHARLGPTVAVADVARLPVADRSIGTVVASWILHLVGDPVATLCECRRVLRNDGRLLVISARGELEPDDIEPKMVDLHDVLRVRLDIRERLVPMAVDCGLVLVGEHLTEAASWEESPADLIERMEKRQWGALIELDDDRFAQHVQPVIDGLRTLPDLDRSRVRTGRHRVFTFAAE
jgi:SAM-dependent methyltransferase